MTSLREEARALMRFPKSLSIIFLTVLLAACGGNGSKTGSPGNDAGADAGDAGTGGHDAGANDAGADDTGAGDAGDGGVGSIDLVDLPAGDFVMGDHLGFGGEDPKHPSDEVPLHTVSLSAFRIARTETTCAQFLPFLEASLAAGDIQVKDGTIVAASDGAAWCDTADSAAPTCITWDGQHFGVTPGTVLERLWDPMHLLHSVRRRPLRLDPDDRCGFGIVLAVLVHDDLLGSNARQANGLR